MVAFGKLRKIFAFEFLQLFKTTVCNQCVLPVMIYESETWPLTMGLLQKLKVTQRAIERAMLGMCLRDQIRYDKKRSRRTKEVDIARRIVEVVMDSTYCKTNRWPLNWIVYAIATTGDNALWVDPLRGGMTIL
jgi:hypothetical protein